MDYVASLCSSYSTVHCEKTLPTYLSPNGNGTTPAPPHRISASSQYRTLLVVRRTIALGETAVVLAVPTAAAVRAGVCYLFHMLPNMPGALFCSAKLALRAVAAMSAELRF